MNQKTCARCIHTSNFPRIKFDDTGICNYCRYYDLSTQLGLDDLKNILKKGRTKVTKYDCLVPISGGLDSSYVLYYVVKVLGLKALAFNFDNGWQHPLAKENMLQLCQTLGCECRFITPDWSTLKAMYRSFLKAQVPDICAPCMVGIYSYMLEIAYQEDIPFIINGSSIRTQGSQPLTMFYVRDGRYFNDILKRFAADIKNNYCTLTLPHYIKYFLIKRIKIFPLPDYLPQWNDEPIVETLQKEVGWSYPPNKLRRFDCQFYPMLLYWSQKKFNFNPLEMKYAALVREKVMTKEEALAKLSAIPPVKDEEIEPILAKLDLSKEEFQRLLQPPHKNFLNYKNYYNIVHIFKGFIKFLTKLGFIQDFIYEYYFSH